MADHIGRRRARRIKYEEDPPKIVDPPPKVIPEEVHTSPHKETNPNTNSGEELRDAPPGVPLKERKIWTLSKKYKSKTNPITNQTNEEIIGLVNEAGDKRCQSYTLQANQPVTRKAYKSICELNEEALQAAKKAQVKSFELKAAGEKFFEIPSFFFKDPVLV